MKEKFLYLSGLNGLRAIAAISVLIAHISLKGLADFGLSTSLELPLAGYGVTLFFVISGFLITYLLLKEKEKIKTVKIKQFYLRRILRIWPIYYLVILISILVFFLLNQQQEVLNVNLLYYIFFAANIPFIYESGILILAHFWSIGVEEQFYIFWPWIVKLKSNKLFLISILILTIIVILKIIFWYFLGSDSIAYRIFQVSRFHCMMIGAIGAIIFYKNIKVIINLCSNLIIQILSWMMFLFVGLNIIHIPAVIGHELLGVISMIIIYGQVTNKYKVIHLEYPIFDFLGKISYGIYIIHPIIIYLLSMVLKDIQVDLPFKYVIVYSLVIGSTITISWLSYTLFEKPFLRLKSKFAVVKSSNSMFTN